MSSETVEEARDRTTRLALPSALGFPILLLAGYLATICFFAVIDPYHNAFFGTKYVFVYNILRLALTGYMVFCVYAAGSLALRALFRRRVATLPVLNYFLLCFFVGAGLWQIFMLAVGHLSLLNRTVALVATAPLILFKGNDLRDLGRAMRSATGGWWSANSSWRRFAIAALALACAAAFAMVVLTKGVYPGGGHDYWLHYFYFFDFALDAQSTLPNRAWYHYFYSKGMGITFLSMVLSDPMGGQLAGLAFLSIGALTLFAVIRRMGASTALALASSTLLLLFYVHTPGIGEIAQNGGWGHLQKNHLTNTVLLFGIVWMVTELVQAEEQNRRFWMTGIVAAIVALSLVSTQSMLLVGLFAALMMLALSVRRRVGPAIYMFLTGCAAAVCLCGVLLLNYAVTGVPLDQFIPEFWPIIDLQKLKPFGGLQTAVIIHQALTGLRSIAAPFVSLGTMELLGNAFFLYVTGPLLLFGLLPILCALALRRRSRLLPPWDGKSTLAALSLFLATVLVAALTAGPAQKISFARFSDFSLFALVAIAAGLWQFLTQRVANLASGWRRRVAAGAPFAILGLTALAFLFAYAGPLRVTIANGLRYFSGQMSIYSAFKHQEAQAGSLPWGAIHPGAESAWLFLGPAVRIESLHIHTYCMLPDCWMQSWASFPLGEDFQQVFYGTPDEARAALQAEKVDHFLYVKSLRMESELPLTALFSPDNIGDYLGVEWTDGDAYLLTWLGPPSVRRLPPDWIDEYRTHDNTVQSPQANARHDQYLRYRPELKYGYEWPMRW